MTITFAAASPADALVPLRGLDVEAVRVPLERELSEALERDPIVSRLLRDRGAPDPARVRRELLGRSLKLTEGMAPEVHGLAREVRAVLGITRPLEIYQSEGRENAAIHLIEEPILLELQGRLLALLDRGASLAVLGHEFGHYLAHGPWTPRGRTGSIAAALAQAEGVPRELFRLASNLSMAQELTADRFGLLGGQDLDAVLRLEMICTTGLSGSALTWDTQAYLAQSRELMEQCLTAGDNAMGTSHPEHSLRAYAVWLFSETELYRSLTGRGPGTRKIEHVNQLIARVLTQPDVEAAYHVYDAPPQEMHECALACCVLVAHADGEVADEEAEAIERVFAALVPDWRAYLEREYAVERLAEVSDVIASAGPEVLRALFNLLMHVVAADGEVHGAEIATVLQIGAYLDAAPLFVSLLRSVLRHLGIAFDERPPPPANLPPRAGEVESALGAFLASIRRRGKGESSLRRLLRLAGESQRSERVVAALMREVGRAGLRCDRDLLAVVDLDDTVQFVSTAPAGAAPPPPRPSMETPDRARLQRALGRLRDELVSGDGRSPSVRMHEARAGRAVDLHALEDVSVGLSERVLAQAREGKKAKLLDAAEVGKFEVARRAAARLVELDREHRQRMDESGACELYLGYPFLSGVAEGYLFRAPLALYPVEIARDERGARGFSLVPRKDDEPVTNQALVRLLFQKRGFALPDELAASLDEMVADPARGVEAVLAELARVGLEAKKLTGQLAPLRDRREEFSTWTGSRFELEECAVLGLFPQSASDLLQDYDGLFADLAAPDADPARLLGCAFELLPAELRAAFAPAQPRFEARAVRPVTPLVHADPSQRAVVDRARSARALVVDGPPGTGKSQVIVNLVADAIGRGERVAVVSEKRAALDVVAQRLAGAGLGDAYAVVHSVAEDRREVYRRVVERVASKETSAHDEAAHDATMREWQGLQGALEARARGLAHRDPAVELTVGQLYGLVAGLDSAVLTNAGALAGLDAARLGQWLSMATGAAPYRDLLGPASPWRGPDGARRASLATFDTAQVRAVRAQIERAIETAAAYERASQACPVPAASLDPARAALETARSTRDLRGDYESQAIFNGVLGASARGPGAVDEAARAMAAWGEGREAVQRAGSRVQIELSPEAERAVATLLSWAGRFFRYFSFAWWGAKGALRRALAAAWPERVGADFDAAFLSELQARVRAARAWRALEAGVDALGLRAQLATTAEQANALVARLSSVLPRVAPIAAARPQLAAVGAWPDPARPPDEWDRAVDERLALLAARDAHLAASAPVAALVPWVGALPASASLAALRDAWSRDAERLVELDLRVEQARQVLPESGALFEELAARTPSGDPGAWRDATVRAWGVAWIARLERTVPEVGALERPMPFGTVEDAERQLAAVTERLTSLERARLRGLLAEGAARRPVESLKGRQRSIREKMLHECGKQRNVMPLRTFVRQFAAANLLDLLPVWLVSPETMAVLFPREPLFDLVIFDEASQCTVENGLPALVRARRAVIAGDDKQMPPSSFFASQAVSDDAAQGEDAVRAAADMLDAESLLTLAIGRAERRRLEWHYRCREEELIAFSNHAMYEGTLRTVPSTATRAAPAVIRWVTVPDGAYDKGTNAPEASRVVDVLDELLRKEKPPSVGVVTFNIQQRKTILDAIDKRRASDAEFARMYDAAAASERVDERPFVKSLENVQGDERDVIVFSLGHAPVERKSKAGAGAKYVPSRFGPLGQRGGERRLNVAVSRARAECVVVASFDPSMLSVARTAHEGPRLFKSYLEFSQHMADGRRAQAERVLDLVRESSRGRAKGARAGVPGHVPLRAQVAAALQERGVACELDVGTSEFRVPVALVDRANGQRYSVAVLCDEGDGAGAADVLDQHLQRPLALRARGWRVLRVSARDWLRRRPQEIERIIAALG